MVYVKWYLLRYWNLSRDGTCLVPLRKTLQRKAMEIPPPNLITCLENPIGLP